MKAFTEAKRTIGRCHQCAFHDRIESVCCAHPPHPKEGWPMVDEDDFCGEFIAKAKTKWYVSRAQGE